MKIGGRIPWNATAVCEIFRISCLMRKHHMKGGSECPFNGPVIPFGGMDEYQLISAKDLSRLHQFGTKLLPGTFLDYVFVAGRIWKGDIKVSDIEELDRMDVSEIHAWRLDGKEVLTPMNGETCIFLVADGTVKLSGEDQVLRTSTSIRDHPDRGE